MKWFVYDNQHEVFDLTLRPEDIPVWLTNEKTRLKLARKKSKALAGSGAPLNSSTAIHLLEDLSAPDLSTCLQVTPDGRYMIMCGAYKPMVKCFDLQTLTMKWQRGVDETCYQLVCLSQDYSQFVLRQSNRYLEFHNRGGIHHRIRVPRHCTSMSYSQRQQALFLVGLSSEVWRLNLVEGAFQPHPSMETSNMKYSSSFTASAIQDDACLLALGSSEGVLELYDTRMPGGTRCAVLDTLDPSLKNPRSRLVRHGAYSNVDKKPYVSKLLFENSLHLGVGFADGMTYLYDLRRGRQPLAWRDQGYGLPVLNMAFTEDKLVSVDAQSVVIWEPHRQQETSSAQGGESPLWCTFNLDERANDMVLIPNSGLLFLANDQAPHVMSYFLPGLGSAPPWCPNLLNYIREKQVDAVSDVPENFQLLTRAEIAKYGLEHLIGTDVLMPRSHCFAINKHKFAAIMKDKVNLLDVDDAPTEAPQPAEVSRLNVSLKKSTDASGKPVELSTDAEIALEIQNGAHRRPYLQRILEDPAFHLDKNHVEYRVLETEMAWKRKKARTKEKRRQKAALAEAMTETELRPVEKS